MAAPQWSGGKCKSVQQAKAFFRHNDKDRRQEQQHTNPHIDKSKTHLNFSYRGLDYGQLCQAYDRRMGEIDQGRQSSGKNARTVMQSVVVYLPAGITDQDTLRRWFMRAGDVLDERFGDNFLDMQVDFDENHEYYDKEKGGMVMSREHGHARFVPEVDGKLNGKQFSSRAAINGLNDALQEMSIREFGVPMMDGSKKKGGRKVEQLKAESEAAAIRAAAEREAAATRAAAQAEANRIITEAAKEREALERWREAQTRTGQQLAQERKQLDAQKQALEARETALEAREAALPGRAALVAKAAVKREIEAAQAAGRRPSAQKAVEAAQAAIQAAARTADRVEDHSQQHRQGSKTLSPV